jgi:hypothetical protein
MADEINSGLGQPISFTQAPSGSTIEPLYTKRTMRAYSVTESELNMLSVINGLAAVCASIATGLLGLCIGIQQEVMFSAELPESGAALRDFARPILFWSAMAFYGFALITLVWRYNTLHIIKREAGDGNSLKGWGFKFWPPRIWRL